MTRCADVDTYVYVNIHVYFLFLKQYVQWICLFVTEWVKLFWDIGDKKFIYVKKTQNLVGTLLANDMNSKYDHYN